MGILQRIRHKLWRKKLTLNERIDRLMTKVTELKALLDPIDAALVQVEAKVDVIVAEVATLKAEIAIAGDVPQDAIDAISSIAARVASVDAKLTEVPVA
jgi:chromosome segregation ATPase